MEIQLPRTADLTPQCTHEQEILKGHRGEEREKAKKI